MRLKPRREVYQTRRRSNAPAAADDGAAAAADVVTAVRRGRREAQGLGAAQALAGVRPLCPAKVGPLARGWARGRVWLGSFQNPAQSTPTNGWWPQQGTKPHTDTSTYPNTHPQVRCLGGVPCLRCWDRNLLCLPQPAPASPPGSPREDSTRGPGASNLIHTLQARLRAPPTGSSGGSITCTGDRPAGRFDWGVVATFVVLQDINEPLLSVRETLEFAASCVVPKVTEELRNRTDRPL